MFQHIGPLFGSLVLVQLCLISPGNSAIETTLKHGGTVRGTEQSVRLDSSSVIVHRYLGIPYALPPIGERRFAAPEPHPGWTGVRNADNFPPTCWQYILEGFDLNNAAGRMWVNNTLMSEDCLYLNIWIPKTSQSSSSLPVMIWIYGGGFFSGSASLDVYDGSILAASQGVILVSMQYRVGALGFLRIDPKVGVDREETQSKVALGNQGLLDQALAIQWTYENIRLFGGDPDTITVFGESAGAVSTSVLWLSPRLENYFHRIILESSSLYARWALIELNEAHMRATEFALHNGCPSPSIDRKASIRCLQKLDPLTAVNAMGSVTTAICKRREKALKKLFPAYESAVLSWATGTCLYFDVPFGPVVDGDLLPDHPDKLFERLYKAKRGRASNELLIGVNRNEGMYFLLYGLALQNATFLGTDGTVTIPDTLSKAATRQPLFPGGHKADFYPISAAQFLSHEMLVSGVSQLPTWFYGLPTQSDSTGSYADPDKTTLSVESLMARMDELTGDLDFVCPTLNFAEKFAQLPNSRVYLYQFRRRTEAMPLPTWTGVMHGYEIEYVFGMPRSDRFQKEFYKFSSEERQLSDEMMKMWANFAKFGDPNEKSTPPGDVTWPQYKPSWQSHQTTNNYLILDTKIESASGLRLRQCRFWLHEVPRLIDKFCTAETGRAPNHGTSRDGLVGYYLLVALLTNLYRVW